MNGLSRQDFWNRIIWIRGIPPIDFWIRRESMIGEFIQANKLKPFDTAGYEFNASAGAVEAKVEGTALAVRRPPFPGGMRIPHLHFKGEVYALNLRQWQSFSGEVIKGLNDKLAKASALSFDDLRNVAEEVDKLA